jgi:DNA-directed RNA polymerase I, II, and III subunit RPABC1
MTCTVFSPILYEMLNDRGFVIIEVQDEISIIARNLDGRRILVYFVNTSKVSVKIMKLIKDIITDDVIGFFSLILVYKGIITSFAKQFITTDINGIIVQVFSEKELCFNVTKHILVPKHELLSREEKIDVLNLYNTKAKHFPNILCTDPVSKYYGFVPGDLIKISRNSLTVGVYVSYRFVI